METKKCQLCGTEFGEHEKAYHRLDVECDMASGRKFHFAFIVSTTDKDEETPKDAELCGSCLYAFLDMWNRNLGNVRESELEIRNMLIDMAAKSQVLTKRLEDYMLTRQVKFENGDGK